VIGDFFGVPRATDPAPAGVATGRHLRFTGEAPADAVPTFRLHMLSSSTGNPVWRGITCGAMTDVELPDLSSIGVVYPPPGDGHVGQLGDHHARPYDTFSYRWLGSAYWRAYASDAWNVQFP
jgi:hypothetical protein